MRISERGQINIAKKLRDQFGMNHDVEVEISPTRKGDLSEFDLFSGYAQRRLGTHGAWSATHYADRFPGEATAGCTVDMTRTRSTFERQRGREMPLVAADALTAEFWAAPGTLHPPLQDGGVRDLPQALRKHSLTRLTCPPISGFPMGLRRTTVGKRHA